MPNSKFLFSLTAYLFLVRHFALLEGGNCRGSLNRLGASTPSTLSSVASRTFNTFAKQGTGTNRFDAPWTMVIFWLVIRFMREANLL